MRRYAAKRNNGEGKTMGLIVALRRSIRTPFFSHYTIYKIIRVLLFFYFRALQFPPKLPHLQFPNLNSNPPATTPPPPIIVPHTLPSPVVVGPFQFFLHNGILISAIVVTVVKLSILLNAYLTYLYL